MVVESESKDFHKVFLVGRERACEQLHRLFSGEINQLLLAVESPEDAEDFVAAFLESLDEKIQHRHCIQCLFLKDANAWLSFSELRKSHVFVAPPKLDIDSEPQLLQAARQQQHRVIIPVSGRWTNGAESVIPLRSPAKGALESVLREAGFAPERVRELASAGAFLCHLWIGK